HFAPIAEVLDFAMHRLHHVFVIRQVAKPQLSGLAVGSDLLVDRLDPWCDSLEFFVRHAMLIADGVGGGVLPVETDGVHAFLPCVSTIKRRGSIRAARRESNACITGL